MALQWEGLKGMFWGISAATSVGWGLLRRVLGMNEMIIRLFTRALGNDSDKAGKRDSTNTIFL